MLVRALASLSRKRDDEVELTPEPPTPCEPLRRVEPLRYG